MSSQPRALGVLVALALGAGSPGAQQWVPTASVTPPGQPLPATPTGFLDEVLVGDFNNAIGMALADDGRAFVWERAGRVWIIEDGVKLSEPFLDIRDEVRHWGDHSMQGLALDPDFASNGHVYVLYAADWHHVEHFGTPSYDPQASELARDSIARVTRYTGNAFDGFRTADESSRLVLLGDTVADGIPVCGTSHGPGSLAFGEDGSLLVSTGDADASPASGTCLSDGILTPEEDVGRFRSQLVDSLSGKLLRLDPTTGDGLPSNPFYDPQEPRAARSRVWALGLRQPFRFAVQPGTGVADMSLGVPGRIAIGDVGGSRAESLHVCDAPGQNFGWPIWEGLDPGEQFGVATPNLQAPNPLFGTTVPVFGPCTQEFFDFQDLIVDDTLNPVSFVNPCDLAQSVVGAPVFVRRRPVLEWHPDDTMPRVPLYDAFGYADSAVLGEPGAPLGDGFAGNCSVGGDWYDGVEFPVAHHGSYFHADFGDGWIRELRFDGAGALLEVLPFVDPAGRVVDVQVNPADGTLWYMDLTNLGASQLHRVRFVTGDLPPTALPELSAAWGQGPLQVVFDGRDSSDPEGGELQHAWDFGDLPPSRNPRVVRTLPSEDITLQGTFTTKLFELDPPFPMGAPVITPDVLRDGIYPPVGSQDDQAQYITAHWDTQTFQPDKGGEDWLGYTFPVERRFHAVHYQEGTLLPNLGGWWWTLEVQVRQGGSWNSVPGAVFDPPYVGSSAVGFETFEIRFPPVQGDGIRLYGIPGGSFEYVSCGELRVLAEPLTGGALPTNVEVTLTVTDGVGGSDSEVVTFSLNNSPPDVVMVKPRNLLVYPNDAPATIGMVADVLDAEHTAGELDLAWQVILHHDDHTHPGPVVHDVAPSAELSSDGCPDVHHQEVRLTVTDPLGLSRTISHVLIPACDLNHNGVDDALDIALGTSLDVDGDGAPDELLADCDGDGIEDVHAVFFGWVRDENGDGIPDHCQTATPGVGARGVGPGPGGTPGGPGGGSVGSGDGVLGDG